jgi:hypothetical protein
VGVDLQVTSVPRWCPVGSTVEVIAAGDLDGDGHGDLAAAGSPGNVWVTGAVFMLTFNFLGGRPPFFPFPACGPALLPSDAVLGCGQGDCT